MQKLRLRKSDRDLIFKAAKALIGSPETERALSVAYRKCAREVTALARIKYPARDMRVLRKYDAGRACPNVRLLLSKAGDASFERAATFKYDPSDAPTVACYGTPTFQAPPEVLPLFEDWEAAAEAHETEIKRQSELYWKLIYTARNLEDVVDLMPEAADLRAEIQQRHQLPSALSSTEANELEAMAAARSETQIAAE